MIGGVATIILGTCLLVIFKNLDFFLDFLFIRSIRSIRTIERITPLQTQKQLMVYRLDLCAREGVNKREWSRLARFSVISWNGFGDETVAAPRQTLSDSTLLEHGYRVRQWISAMISRVSYNLSPRRQTYYDLRFRAGNTVFINARNVSRGKCKYITRAMSSVMKLCSLTFGPYRSRFKSVSGSSSRYWIITRRESWRWN